MGFPAPRMGMPPGESLPPEPLTEFYIPVSDTQAYRQFGNAVVVDVIEHLACALVGQASLIPAEQEVA